MLNAYIDDSNMNMPPVCVLGGWIGTVKEWASFSDSWVEALWMKPRLDYFKLTEAQNFTGQFNGWSEQSRDERLRLLVKIIERYKFLGVTNAIPYDAYKEVFGELPDKSVRNPYFVSFLALLLFWPDITNAKDTRNQLNSFSIFSPDRSKLLRLLGDTSLK
jgi:hypothetical protein